MLGYLVSLDVLFRAQNATETAMQRFKFLMKPFLQLAEQDDAVR
jgi:hypothetical protein